MVRCLLVLVVLAACSESLMTPAVYFSELEAARDGFAQAGDDIDDRYVAELDASFRELEGRYDLEDPAQAEEFARRTVEISVLVTAAFVEARVESLERYSDALSALRPPEVAAEAHAASLDAVRMARDGLEATLAAVRSVEGVGGLEAAVSSSPVGEALVRTAEACRVLQSAAGGEGLQVNLQCP